MGGIRGTYNIHMDRQRDIAFYVGLDVREQLSSSIPKNVLSRKMF